MTDLPITIVERGGGNLLLYLRDVLRFRDALFFMVRRDIKVRYTQTVLGFGWAVLQPFTQVIVFSVFFGHLAHVSADGEPYAVFSVAAVVPWTYFSNVTTAGSTSLVGSSSMLSKIYFPRALMALTPVGAGLVDFAIGVGLLLGVLGAYGRTPPASAIIYAPILALAAVFAALGLSLWLAPLAIQYRDVRYIAPFLIQTLMFVTPVIYANRVVPHSLRAVYALNPMVGVVNGSRAAFLGNAAMPWGSVALSFLVSSFLIVTGLSYFRRTERIFADVA